MNNDNQFVLVPISFYETHSLCRPEQNRIQNFKEPRKEIDQRPEVPPFLPPIATNRPPAAEPESTVNLEKVVLNNLGYKGAKLSTAKRTLKLILKAMKQPKCNVSIDGTTMLIDNTATDVELDSFLQKLLSNKSELSENDILIARLLHLPTDNYQNESLRRWIHVS